MESVHQHGDRFDGGMILKPPPSVRANSSAIISTDGPIGIFLGLIGLLGAGLIMIAPSHLEIGYGLIAFSAVGLVGLGWFIFWE